MNLNNEFVFRFAHEFTDIPIGRFRTDGDLSAEVFRDDILIPLLANHNKVILDLNGVFGFGSSFLDEAFCGIIRRKLYTVDELLTKLEIICDDDPMTVRQIHKYLNNC